MPSRVKMRNWIHTCKATDSKRFDTFAYFVAYIIEALCSAPDDFLQSLFTGHKICKCVGSSLAPGRIRPSLSGHSFENVYTSRSKAVEHLNPSVGDVGNEAQLRKEDHHIASHPNCICIHYGTRKARTRMCHVWSELY